MSFKFIEHLAMQSDTQLNTLRMPAELREQILEIRENRGRIAYDDAIFVLNKSIESSSSLRELYDEFNLSNSVRV